MIWPRVETPAAFDAIARDETALAPGIQAIAQAIGATAPPVRFADGSLPVYALGDDVLKVYPPLYAEECVREHDTGWLAGWGWNRMTRLPGERTWPGPEAATELGGDGVVPALGGAGGGADEVERDVAVFDGERDVASGRWRSGGVAGRG